MKGLLEAYPCLKAHTTISRRDVVPVLWNRPVMCDLTVASAMVSSEAILRFEAPSHRRWRTSRSLSERWTLPSAPRTEASA